MSNHPEFVTNAITFLQRRFPRATVMSDEAALTNADTGELVLKFWTLIAQDPASGIKQRVIALPEIGSNAHLVVLAKNATNIFDKQDKKILIGFGNANPKGHEINTMQMPFAPRVIIYSKEITVPYQVVMDAFATEGGMIDIVVESEMFSSLFISYGDPDKEAASSINKYLQDKGIQTWFFPDKAPPGQKLHRMMHEEVNHHDRMLLLCSKSSLARAGVLNELEKVLEREAREGGAEILIPIALDDYVYKDWAPTRPDIAEQVRSRVITKIDMQISPESGRNAQLEKLVAALAHKSR